MPTAMMEPPAHYTCISQFVKDVVTDACCGNIDFLVMSTIKRNNHFNSFNSFINISDMVLPSSSHLVCRLLLTQCLIEHLPSQIDGIMHKTADNQQFTPHLIFL